jgi:hypothetical protein
MVIEPPPHFRVRRESEIHAGVIVGVEWYALERISVAVDHPDGNHGRIAVDDVAIERGEQSGRRRPVEARVVEENL